MIPLQSHAGRPFLLLAHPGHELRLFQWIERHRPRVFVLSDGSGSHAASRISYSRAVIARAGASPGAVFGLLPDRCWYAAMLRAGAAPFRQVLDTVLAALREERPALLISDAVDGYNPLHDLTEVLGAALAAAVTAEGGTLRHLCAPATAGAIGSIAEAWTLDDAVADRKCEAIAAYAPLAEEAARILGRQPDALRIERLLVPIFDWREAWHPEWERLGRQRVRKGIYARAINYADHVRPLARAILEHYAVPAQA